MQQKLYYDDVTLKSLSTLTYTNIAVFCVLTVLKVWLMSYSSSSHLRSPHKCHCITKSFMFLPAKPVCCLGHYRLQHFNNPPLLLVVMSTALFLISLNPTCHLVLFVSNVKMNFLLCILPPAVLFLVLYFLLCILHDSVLSISYFSWTITFM